MEGERENPWEVVIAETAAAAAAAAWHCFTGHWLINLACRRRRRRRGHVRLQGAAHAGRPHPLPAYSLAFSSSYIDIYSFL